jgi:hypothetical protein
VFIEENVIFVIATPGHPIRVALGGNENGGVLREIPESEPI